MKRLPADSSQATDPDTALTSVTDISTSYTGASVSGALTTYAALSPGDTTYLGDHMALVVEEISSAVTTPGEILNNYS